MSSSPPFGDPLGDFKFDLGEVGGADTQADLDPSEGEWVFKQDGVVLGPVSAAILMQRIDEGELDEDTPIGRSAGEWVALKEVPYFQRAYKRAEARIKRIEVQEAHERAMKKRSVVRLTALAGLAVGPLVAGTLAGYLVMVARPWDDTQDWVQRAPPLVDLKPRPKPPPPPPTPPEDENKDDPENKDPDEAKTDDDKTEDDKKDTRRKRRRRKVVAKKTDDKPEEKKDEPKKAGSTLTTAQVTAGFKKGYGDLGKCIKAEFARDKERNSLNFRVEFTITESGRAINTRILERQYRNGPLNACVVKAVSKLRWPKFSGERRNATFPLRAKRPS